MNISILAFALFFYLIYMVFFVLIDATLYMVVWHRCILLENQGSIARRPGLVTDKPYNNDSLISAATNNTGDTLLDGISTSGITTATSTPDDTNKINGKVVPLLLDNYNDCKELRKVLALPNTFFSTNKISLQQMLSDNTLNFLHCVLAGRLSGH